MPQRGDRNVRVTGNDLDSAGEVATSPEFQTLLHEQYRFIKEVDRFSLYQQKARRPRQRTKIAPAVWGLGVEASSHLTGAV